MSKPEVLGISANALPVTSGAILLSGHIDTWLLAGFIALGVISTVISLGYIKRYATKR
jgi:hypothetical protein